MKKTTILAAFHALFTLYCFSQEFNMNNIQHDFIREDYRKTINIPNILGYESVKCDFHIHTVFSDGDVWPTQRVTEAWRDGLDLIAITDHIEGQPSRKFIGGDNNSSYDLAKDLADQMGILLVRGGEVSRSMPPGHLNAMFVSDVNTLNVKEWREALKKTKSENGFIMWNHPGWKPQQPDTCLWWPEHEEIYNNGMLHGIEVSCGREWYPIALDWCMEKDLAPISNSDIHVPIEYKYKYGGNFIRSLTLVFAKEKTIDSVKEAMLDGRTVALFGNNLAGKAVYLKELFKNSIAIQLSNSSRESDKYKLANSSDLTFEIKMGDRVFTLHPHASIFLSEDSLKSKAEVTNLLTGSRSCLNVTLIDFL